MNRKTIALVIACFALVAVISLLVIGLSSPKDTSTANKAPQSNTQTTAAQDEPEKQPNGGVKPPEDKPADMTAEEIINVKTKRAEFNFYITRTDQGFYMDIQRISDDGYRTGYYITGLEKGYFYSTRDIIDPQTSDAKDFYLPDTYMNEGIAFGNSTKEDHAACFINDKKGSSDNASHSDLTVRAVNIDLGTLIDILDLTIDLILI